jgi:hypothetical protein
MGCAVGWQEFGLDGAWFDGGVVNYSANSLTRQIEKRKRLGSRIALG